jgi:flagellar biosynthesis GTPase FlhF
MPNATVRANARTLPKTAKSLAEQISAKAWILDELTAAEAKLREARTKAKDQPQAAAAEASRNQSDVIRYLNLEEPVYELTFMTGIARDLAYELLDVEKPSSEEVVLRLSKREHAQLFFAIRRAHDMAEELEALYYRQHAART